MNSKLLQHKYLLQEMVAIIEQQEIIEETIDFDDAYVKEKENECIEEYSTKLAGLMQLSFNQVITFPSSDLLTGKSNARVLGTIVINEEGVAEAHN
ncbi:MAG: hypothetical protein ACTHLB_14540 [Parafilimonas sp.]